VSDSIVTDRIPFLLRFGEAEDSGPKPAQASPERGGESNPYEEAPPKEPTKRGPYGD